jgi:exoribonuclease R
MQYFKEHIDECKIIANNNYIEGIFNIIDDKNSVTIHQNDKNIIDVDNNRALMNDIVYVIDNKVVNIKNRSSENIIGILYLDSKIKYGSLKDKPLYLFKPTNKDYPNFYVPYKNNNKDQLHKIYAIIQFKKWDITDKLPIGTLIESIGKIGDENSEFEHLRIFYNLRNNNWKVDNNKLKSDIELLNNLKNINEDYLVFSIDPEGSKDIDDAFHFNKIDNNYEIGIHIASPNKFFENNLFEIMDRVSTLYLPDKKYNMLPNNYADNYISLLENEKRFAISLILKFDENFNIINEEIKESVVKNIKNYSYEEFDNKFGSTSEKKQYNSNKDILEFISFSIDFFKEETKLFDSHKLVENWMIFTNKKVAQFLIDKNIPNLILRKHQESKHNICNEHSDNIKLKTYLNYKNENSAMYEIYDKNLTQFHYKLGNEYYTHFTSPIRRSVDFYIHSLIINNIKNDQKKINKENLDKIVDNINIFTKKSRKFNRNIKRLNFIFSIKNFEENIKTYAYIIKISNNNLTIYIPEYDLEEKVIIIPKKLENIANIVKKYDIDNNIIINKIDFTIDEINKKYYLYQKIDIKLWIFTSFENFFDKIKIEIL